MNLEDDAVWEVPRKPYLGRPAGCWCSEGEHEHWCPHWGKPRVWVHPAPRKEGNRTVANLSFYPAYAYSPRQGAMTIARTHAALTDSFQQGRFRREKGDALCKTRNRFWGLEPTEDYREVDCPVCVERLRRYSIEKEQEAPSAMLKQESELPPHRVLEPSYLDPIGDPPVFAEDDAWCDERLPKLREAMCRGQQLQCTVDRKADRPREVATTAYTDPETGERRFAVEVWQGSHTGKHDFADKEEALKRHAHYRTRLGL